MPTMTEAIEMIFTPDTMLALPDDWETLCDAGREISSRQDANRWTMGALAHRVERKHGERSLKKFSGDINLASSKTLYDYWRVWRFYDDMDIDGFSAHAEFPNLSWSHFRTAMQAGENALEMLGRAAGMGWTISEFDRELKRENGNRVPPRKVFEERGKIRMRPPRYKHPSIDIELVPTIEIPEVELESLIQIVSGKTVKVVIYVEDDDAAQTNH